MSLLRCSLPAERIGLLDFMAHNVRDWRGLSSLISLLNSHRVEKGLADFLRIVIFWRTAGMSDRRVVQVAFASS